MVHCEALFIFWFQLVTFVRNRPQQLEGAHQILPHAHHTSGVVKLTAVIRSREDRHDFTVLQKACYIETSDGTV